MGKDYKAEAARLLADHDADPQIAKAERGVAKSEAKYDKKRQEERKGAADAADAKRQHQRKQK